MYNNSILKSSQDTKTQLENSYTFEEAIAFLCALGFYIQVLSDLQCVLKWRTLHPTKDISWWGVSHVLGSMQRKKSLQDQD